MIDVATLTVGAPIATSSAVTARGLDDLRGTLGRLIRLATGSECSRSLVDAAWQDLRRPLAVVDATGAIVAAAPMAGAADVAIGFARACAAGLADPPSGWIARRLHEEDRTVGWLVMQQPDVISSNEEAVVEALGGLLAAQLGRTELRRSVMVERQAAIRKRMVTNPGSNVADLVAEGENVGVQFASAYWPSLVVWRQGELSQATVREATRTWQAHASPLSFLDVYDGAVALLYAEQRPGTLKQSDVEMAVASTVSVVSRQRPALEAHGVMGENCVALDRLHTYVRMIRQVRRYATQATASPPVLPMRRFALNRLLEGVSPARAQSFVGQSVGPLLAYDERHGSNLAETLELALEYPKRDDAARAAFMHRNTFRRRLQQALELIDADLGDPEQRIVLHVALKLRRHPSKAALRSSWG
ncbi:MAG TPA: helix-turn-helix domain-containing protein [Solirubrobacteraceae bacterium]|nr:helix-turn-helix domain-containing protein [Solirubrobacteraceae bacterium]